MSHDHQPPQPASDGSDWNAGKEKELDSLLDQACSLADQLKSEVGTSESAAKPAPKASKQAKPDDTTVDRQLEGIDQLLESAKSEIGLPTSQSQPAATEKASATVPDFMAEFTQPTPSAVAGSEQRPTSESPRSSQSQTGSASSSESTPQSPHSHATTATVAGEDELEDDLLALSAGTPRSITPPAQPQIVDDDHDETAPPVRQSGGLTTIVADPLVRVLTLVNRPFDRIGARARVFIGYAAIVMFIAAMVAFAVSLV